MLTAAEINVVLEERFPSSMIGTEHSYPELSKRLSSVCRSLQIRSRVVKNKKIKFGKRQDFDITAFYDTGAKSLPIMITLHVDPNRSGLKISRPLYNRLLLEISQAIQHEIVHQRHDEKNPKIFDESLLVRHSPRMSKKRITKIEYLSNKSEIDAHAHDIAVEINAFYPNLSPDAVIKKIDSMKKIKTYGMYRRVFKNMEWDHIRKMLLRKVWKWIPTARPPRLIHS